MKKLKIALLAAFLMGSVQLQAGDGYEVGDKATGFKLKNVDTEYVSLKDYPEAKGFVVIFTCNHCPWSQAYEQRIIDLHNEYAPKGYPVIAVNSNDSTNYPSDSFTSMQKRAAEKNYPFPYLLDDKKKN